MSLDTTYLMRRKVVENGILKCYLKLTIVPFLDDIFTQIAKEVEEHIKSSYYFQEVKYNEKYILFIFHRVLGEDKAKEVQRILLDKINKVFAEFLEQEMFVGPYLQSISTKPSPAFNNLTEFSGAFKEGFSFKKTGSYEKDYFLEINFGKKFLKVLNNIFVFDQISKEKLTEYASSMYIKQNIIVIDAFDNDKPTIIKTRRDCEDFVVLKRFVDSYVHLDITDPKFKDHLRQLLLDENLIPIYHKNV